MEKKLREQGFRKSWTYNGMQYWRKGKWERAKTKIENDDSLDLYDYYKDYFEKQIKSEKKEPTKKAKTSQSKCNKELENQEDLDILWTVIIHLFDENDDLTKKMKDWKTRADENINTAVEWYKQIKQLKSDKSFYQKAFWIALIGRLTYWILYNFVF